MPKKSKIRIIPLGGLDEIGKNMTAIEYGNEMIVIDCGMAFPDEEMFGIDIVIPDFSFVVKNKDKIVLSFMFLFPFFPDDVLCFVAGLSSMSSGYFLIMITVCRIISVFTSAYSLNGSIIPFNTSWGIVLWVLIVALTILATVILYKKGDNIEDFIKNKLRRKSR